MKYENNEQCACEKELIRNSSIAAAKYFSIWDQDPRGEGLSGEAQYRVLAMKPAPDAGKVFKKLNIIFLLIISLFYDFSKVVCENLAQWTFQTSVTPYIGEILRFFNFLFRLTFSRFRDMRRSCITIVNFQWGRVCFCYKYYFPMMQEAKIWARGGWNQMENRLIVIFDCGALFKNNE